MEISVETLDNLYWASSIANAVLAAVFVTLSFYHARKRKDGSLFWYLLTGFFACAALCGVYYSLTTVLLEYPYVISPGDLSWAGALVFLITAALDMIDRWAPEQKQAARKYRFPALTAPIVVAAFNVAYIAIYPQITANYLLYAIPTAILAYYALLLFLCSGKGGIQPSMHPYYGIVLLWLLAQLIHDLFSTFGSYYGWLPHMVIFAWIVTFTTPLIYLAARKGART